MSKRKAKVTHKVDGAEVVKITEERLPRVVLWADLLAACEWVGDDYAGVPWEDEDGWEHEFCKARDFDDAANTSEMCGFVCPSRGPNYVVTVAGADPWGVGAYARARGASRQVAAELAAENKRLTIETLARWRGDDGYSSECCVLKFGDYRASLSGIGEPDEAYRREVESELAAEVAADLVKDGFKIKGRPRVKKVVRPRGDVNVFSLKSRRCVNKRWRKFVKLYGRRPISAGDMEGGAV